MRLAAAALAELSRGPVAAADLARLAALAEEAHDSAAALRYAAGAARHAAAVRGGRLVDVACRRLAGANRSSGRRDRRGGGGTVPARAGRHEAAAEEWARIGCPYEEALSLARTGASGRRRALALLDGLGARVTMAVVSRALRASGARALPRGPLRRTRANPFGLTAREVEVCSLLRGPAGGG